MFSDPSERFIYRHKSQLISNGTMRDVREIRYKNAFYNHGLGNLLNGSMEIRGTDDAQATRMFC